MPNKYIENVVLLILFLSINIIDQENMMTSNLRFEGFSKQTINFFKDLKNNNSKQWFEKNREIFDNHVMLDSQLFVTAMGQKLEKIAPEIVAIPKTDKSIFRIHRDVRFSKDKSPYKTHLGMLFWEGPFKKMENPGFYFHIEPSKLFLAVGMHMMPKNILQMYRESVVHKLHGPALLMAIKNVEKSDDYKLGWKKYKQTPRGFDDTHPNAEYLLYGGIGFQYEE
ncbi:unnamed protein product, partial [marine sediment metagenome]